MRSFARELSEKELGYMPKTVSRHIAGYLTSRNKVRYQVNIKGVFGGTFLTFEEADEKRRKMLREMEAVNMTWTELCEKAKEIGGAVCSESEYESEKIVFNNFLFYKNGRITFDDTDEDGYCSIVHNIKSDVTYEQMLAIMEALK